MFQEISSVYQYRTKKASIYYKTETASASSFEVFATSNNPNLKIFIEPVSEIISIRIKFVYTRRQHRQSAKIARYIRGKFNYCIFNITVPCSETFGCRGMFKRVQYHGAKYTETLDW